MVASDVSLGERWEGGHPTSTGGSLKNDAIPNQERCVSGNRAGGHSKASSAFSKGGCRARFRFRMSDTAAWQSGANSIKPSSVEGNICAFAEGLNDGLGIVRSRQPAP